MTTTVQQILDGKGDAIHAISPDATVYDAIKLMDSLKVGALLVMEGEKMVGIISERDYTRKVVLKNKMSRNTPVKEIMTSQVIYVNPHQTIDECLVLMSVNHIRHLPIVENNKTPVGILSVMDVVKDIISEKEFIIEQLENYISGVG